MNKINLLVTGAAGKMGAAVLELVANDSRFRVVAAIDRKDNELPDVEKSGEVHAAIDFSSPRLLSEVLDWAVRAKVPVVSGTTGLVMMDHEKLKKASLEIPVLWSPNFSAGIQLFEKWIKQLSGFAFQYEVQIEETHHVHKKDSPSGTAIFLKSALDSAMNQSTPEPISYRKDEEFGVHILKLIGKEETLTINHTALNRNVFARGALESCAWLMTQKPALYQFSQVFERK